jgi:hypothetical protein
MHPKQERKNDTGGCSCQGDSQSSFETRRIERRFFLDEHIASYEIGTIANTQNDR